MEDGNSRVNFLPSARERAKRGRRFGGMENPCYFCLTGRMAEWSIAAVLKTVELQGSGGSNPSPSATNAENQQIAKQTPSFTPKNVKSGVFVLFKIIQPLHNKRVAILKESDEKRLIFIYPFSLIFQDFTSS